MDPAPPAQSAPPTHRHPSRPWVGLLVALAVVLAIAGFQIKSGFRPSHPPTTQAAPKYHCPMHPSVVSDKPGSCPICGMDLVLIGEAGNTPHPALKSGVAGLAVISIPPQARQTMGLKLGTVEKRPVAREVRTSARLVVDETRQWRVTPKTDGWIGQLFVSYEGQEVKKGDPLLTIYSPALVSAQSEYLAALRAHGTASLDPVAASARKRLELWDISAAQIENLTRTGTVEMYLTLHAPASGVVISREVLAGQKIAPGDNLMVIADLSTLWGEADIYQSDLPYVKTGMPLTLSLPYWPGKSFEGKVIFVSPTLDPESRTLRARLEIPNPQALLKPGMFADARLLYDLGPRLTLPASAVMFGGQRTYAFRDNGDSHLIPTEIELGTRAGEAYELLGGLNEGDRVVVSANFLVDSESNLKSAMEALNTAPPVQAIPAADFENTLAAYLKIQAALASDDLSKTREAAAGANLMELANAATLAEARQAFLPLSASILAAAKKHDTPSGQPLTHWHCPMAADGKGGDWLQPAGEPRNPYFGKEMLGCGEAKGEIPPRTPTNP